MQLISKYNKGIRFILCLLDIHNKYARNFPLKDKKGIRVAKMFKNCLVKSGSKPNKIWVDKGSEFYNRSMKSWLQDNIIDMCSTHNEKKFAVAKKLIRTL